jgi:membrane-associated phospholipid phosphatase
VATLVCTQRPVAAQTHEEPKPGSSSAAVPSSSTSSLNSRPSAAVSGNFLADLVGPTFGGFKALPSAETATILGVGGAFAFLGHAFDSGTTRVLSADAVDPAFQPGETIGGAGFQMGGALAAYTVGRLTGKPRLAQVGGDLFRAHLIAQTMTATIKMSVRRTRPDGTQFSFPSGHSSVTFASATVLQRDFGWKVGIPAYAVASYVAASRINEERHFLSDVLFGAAVGIVAGRTATIGTGDARFALTPMAAPGGGGIGFTWLGKR